MNVSKNYITLLLMIPILQSCMNSQQLTTSKVKDVTLVTIAPGHFHAALVQKENYPEVNKEVYVYAPQGNEVNAYLKLIDTYNQRKVNPTHWKEIVYTGPDYLEKMLQQKKGNVVILAGNNGQKTNYIKQSIDAGLNVLADKPMAIDAAGFEQLKAAFESAAKNKVLLYDIMTERYEINSILQKELSLDKEVFGLFEKGTTENPAIIKESVHHFFKYVSGAPLVRPPWYYDTKQQGEGLVDVTTHLTDLIQWVCFPEQIIDWKKDIQMLNAKRWTTKISAAQFKLSTNTDTWPANLKNNVHNNVLDVYSNGEMNYTIKGSHAKVSVIWNFQAAEGSGDTHFSIMRGTKANLIIRQGAQQKYRPELYVEPANKEAGIQIGTALQKRIAVLQKQYPGINILKEATGWKVVIPDVLRTSHEAHFAEVTRKYLNFLKQGKVPKWEIANILAKYYTTTQALEKALK